MKRIFITGGAGFIGSHIAEALLQEGYEVTIYDNFDSGSMRNIANMKEHVRIVRGDILDYEKLARAMKKHDYVSHQAAQLEILRCIDNPLYDLNANTVATLHVLKAAVKNNIQKIVNASSGCIYGQAVTVPETEEHPQNPNWPYGVSKLAAEKYCQIYQHNYDIAITSLRYGIVYGPREWFGRVLTYFIKRAVEGKPLVVFDKNVTRDFIFVSDIVSFHNACLQNQNTDNQVFNVATSVGTRIYDLAKTVRKVVGFQKKIIVDSPAEGKSSKYMPERNRLPSELKTMILGIKKAREATGWVPHVGLEDGIMKEAEWFKANRECWTTKGRIRV